MSIPMAVCLTSRRTGKQFSFDSIRQAEEFLERCNGYIRYRTVDCQNRIVESRWNEEFDLEVTGTGTRRPWKCVKGIKRRAPAEIYVGQPLCFTCARACGLCSWSHNLTPVKGWSAEIRKIEHDNFESYRVMSCPKYVKDAKTSQEQKIQRELLIKEYENETGKKIRREAGPAAPAAACRSGDLRNTAQAMAEAAAGASDQQGAGVCC